ncbi:MAG: hypothetical protein ACRDWW_07760, partial [Acidimicrobiales bacterium]
MKGSRLLTWRRGSLAVLVATAMVGVTACGSGGGKAAASTTTTSSTVASSGSPAAGGSSGAAQALQQAFVSVVAKVRPEVVE